MADIKKLLESIDRISEMRYPPADHPYWKLTPAERIKQDSERVAADSREGYDTWKHMKLAKEPGQVTKPESNKDFVGDVHRRDVGENSEDTDPVDCPMCHGSGQETAACEWCEGNGCSQCDGSGKHSRDCDWCSGDGDYNWGFDPVKEESEPQDYCAVDDEGYVAFTGSQKAVNDYIRRNSGGEDGELHLSRVGGKSIQEDLGDGTEFVHMGAKVYCIGQSEPDLPFEVVRIIDDQRVMVKDEYGNIEKMFIKDLVPADNCAPGEPCVESADLKEELAAQFEEYVKDKSKPDPKKTFKITKDREGVFIVKNEKGIEVKRGDKMACNQFVEKKKRELNDSHLAEDRESDIAQAMKDQEEFHSMMRGMGDAHLNAVKAISSNPRQKNVGGVEKMKEGWVKTSPQSQERVSYDKKGQKIKTPDGEGTIIAQYKVPTFSRDVPFVHTVRVKFENSEGLTKEYRAKECKIIKEPKSDFNAQTRAFNKAKSNRVNESDSLLSHRIADLQHEYRSEMAKQNSLSSMRRSYAGADRIKQQIDALERQLIAHKANKKSLGEGAFSWQGTELDDESMEELSQQIFYTVRHKFGGKAWFLGNGWNYMVDVSKPNELLASDGAVVKCKNVAQGLKDYAGMSHFGDVMRDFMDGYDEVETEFFRHVRQGQVREGKRDFAGKIAGKIAKHNKAVVSTKREIGHRIADIGPGGKESNVKTDAAWDKAHKVSEAIDLDKKSTDQLQDDLRYLRPGAKNGNAGFAKEVKAIEAELARRGGKSPAKKQKPFRDAAATGNRRDFANEAKGKSENRELWDRIKSRGVQPDIDRERYTDLSHEGLEGPFRLKSGKVVYYDPKQGAYYDRDTDMYMDNEETDMHRESVGDKSPKQAKIAKMKALLDDLQIAVQEAKKKVSGKSLKEAPIDQVVAGAVPGQPGQPPVPGQQAPSSQLVPGQPLTPSQQPPAPAGTSTVQPIPGQPTPPQAGQAGGAPVAPPPGTPVPPQGGAANNATTPNEQMKQFVNTMANNPAAAKQMATKMNTVR